MFILQAATSRVFHFFVEFDLVIEIRHFHVFFKGLVACYPLKMVEDNQILQHGKGRLSDSSLL